MTIRNYFMKSATLVSITTAIAGFLVTAPSIAADAKWHVKEAPVRFKVALKEKPADKSSGYLLHLPDGGILPGAFPLTHVVTEGGKQLASYVLWQSKGNGALIVFEDPGAEGNAFVYVSGSDKLTTWNPQTGLKPGPVICAEEGTDSMDAARNLSKTGQAGPRSYFQKYGTSVAPFGMTGDVQGRPNPMCYYVLAYLTTTDPGKTLVAMTVFNGNVQLRLDGQLVTPQRISSKPGGMGQWMELSKGLHKVEVYCSIGLTGTGKKQVGIGGTETMSKEQLCAWTMGWRTPNTKIEDLGGPRPKELPAPGSPMWESHKINPEDIARSGSCKIMEINSRDGGPVAACKLESTETFWFEEEMPIFTYELTAIAAGNPENTQYTWTFGDAAKASGQKTAWFFRRGMQTMNLTASSGGKQSTCSIPFYAFSGARSSMDSPETKDNFRKACLSMIKAYPPEADPTATWNKTMWNCFFDAQEFGKGSELLDEVLTKRWAFFASKVQIEKQVMLEDIFFNWISQNDPDKAIKWLIDQEKASPSADRKNDLRIMHAEVLIYQKAKYEDAKKILAPIAKGAGDAAATANVRLGDIAFLEKNINEANNYWSAVQNRVKMTQDDIKGEGNQIKWDDGSKDRDKNRKQGIIEADPKAFTSTTIKNEKVDAWKKAATWETSKALNVTTLLIQGFPLEAYQELRRWERNLPMCKINSDYIIQEANFYLAINNSKRARKLLEAYCDNIDASAYVANAAELLLQCMMKDKESDKVLKKFCEDMKKRFEFHPLVQRMDDLMRVVGADGIKREATIDKL